MAYKQDKMVFLDSFLNIFTFLFYGYTFNYAHDFIEYKYYKMFFLIKQEVYKWDKELLNYYIFYVMYYIPPLTIWYDKKDKKGKANELYINNRKVMGFINKSKKFLLSSSSLPLKDYSRPLFR